MTENAFIQEVDDALKQERLETLWKKYGNYVISGAIALVLGTALVTGWNSWNKSQNEKETTRLVEVIKSAEPQGVDFKEMIKNTRPAHKAIAILDAAGSHIEQKEKDKAITLYEELSQDSTAPTVFRDLATIMATRLELSNENIETDKLLSILTPISNDPSNPWYLSALFHKALVHAHGEQDLTKAIQTLNILVQTEDAPPILKEKATALIHVYTLEQDTKGTE